MAINFHDAPLPAYAGLYATSWALLGAEPQHGVTWHTMEAAVDEGEILAQERFDVAVDETAFTLNAKCYEAGISSFQELVGDLESGELEPRPQGTGERRYFSKFQRPRAAAS